VTAATTASPGSSWHDGPVAAQDDGDAPVRRAFWRGLLIAGPLGVWVTWLFWRGSPLVVPMAVVAFVVTSPCAARVGSLEERTTPEATFGRGLGRAKALARSKSAEGWKGRIELIVQAPGAAFGLVWFGLGTLILVGWDGWRRHS
jgi:hypothetical protein